MKKQLLLAAVLLSFTTAAEAKTGHVLRGLFCNTRAQVEQTLANMRRDVPLAAAVAITNGNQIDCVFAYKIKYMVTHPVGIGQVTHFGQSLTLYEATLIGVLVGGNPRPIAPPLQTFFISMDPIEDAAIEDAT